ncbi:FAFR422Wp [Eremothecium gossypii FDAG1]|nr:FAFR422Wp [Eremothecium gossypii FDAG1]
MTAEPLFKKQKVSNRDEPEESKPWVEKYRPRKLDDVASQAHAITVLKRTLESANLPHMLFYGPPGTGKTSTILALTKELFGPSLMKSRVLELNASDERGISIVREKVKNFARLTVTNPTKEDLEQYPCPPYKIIILDEADSMTADAQSALRRTMETYSSVTRFCLICNYVTRIIDPLASRCSKFRFKPLDNVNALGRLEQIAQQEALSYEAGALEKVLHIAEGDLRKAITLLQTAAKMTSYMAAEKITTAQVEELAGVVPDDIIKGLVEKIESKDLTEITKFVNKVVKSGWCGSSIISQLHDYYAENNELDAEKKTKIFLLLFKTDSRLSNGTDEHIQLLDLAMKITQV